MTHNGLPRALRPCHLLSSIYSQVAAYYIRTKFDILYIILIGYKPDGFSYY